MASRQRDRDVLWVGANDGPVHVTRDGGKTWKNVTPKDLPPGGRVQNIDASPHRKGTAYIAVYRFLFEHDLKPYIYATDDYGATWTKLTDGTNGIPERSPDARRPRGSRAPGLLYAGTEFGFFVSFDNGRKLAVAAAEPSGDARSRTCASIAATWSISTMGRSFWIMDDVSPLRQLAAGARDTQAGAAVQPLAAARSAIAARAAAAAVTAPQYPPVALPIDYILPDGLQGSAVAGDHRLHRPGRSHRAGGGAAAVADRAAVVAATRRSRHARRRRGGRGGRAVDARKPGTTAICGTTAGNGGPLAAPGRYTATLIIGTGDRRAIPCDARFEVKVDPGVIKDGTTVADLVEQQNFLLQLRDTMTEASLLRTQAAAGDAEGGRAAAAVAGPRRVRSSAMKYRAPAPGTLGAARHRARHLRAGDAARSAQQHRPRRERRRSEGRQRVAAPVRRSDQGDEGHRRRPRESRWSLEFNVSPASGAPAASRAVAPSQPASSPPPDVESTARTGSFQLT